MKKKTTTSPYSPKQGERTTFLAWSPKRIGRRIFEVNLKCCEVVGNAHKFTQLQRFHSFARLLVEPLEFQRRTGAHRSEVLPLDPSLHSHHCEGEIDSFAVNDFIRLKSTAMQRFFGSVVPFYEVAPLIAWIE